MSGETAAGPFGRNETLPADGRREGLLDRPLPAGYRGEWTRHFAEPERGIADEAGGEERTVILFRIGEEWLALAAALFQEVAEPRRYHSLPHRRDDLVLGIVNVRGELVVCISLGSLLGVADARGGERVDRVKAFPRLAVISRDGRRAAFPVDEVHGVHRHTAGDVVDVPATIGKSASPFISAMIAWKGRTVGRLNDDRLLDAIDRGIA